MDECWKSFGRVWPNFGNKEKEDGEGELENEFWRRGGNWTSLGRVLGMIGDVAGEEGRGKIGGRVGSGGRGTKGRRG